MSVSKTQDGLGGIESLPQKNEAQISLPMSLCPQEAVVVQSRGCACGCNIQYVDIL